MGGSDSDFVESTWHIDINRSGVLFRRLHNDQVVESYLRVSFPRAAVFVAAIIQGFQPPAHLVPIDKL